MRTLVIASGNAGKIREFQGLLQHLPRPERAAHQVVAIIIVPPLRRLLMLRRPLLRVQSRFRLFLLTL